jgi:hypothetical protein
VLAKGEGGPGSELPEPPRLCSFAWPPFVAFVALIDLIDPSGGLSDGNDAISLRRLERDERRVVRGFVGEILYASRLGGDRSVRVVRVRVDLVEGAGEEAAVLLRPKAKDAMCSAGYVPGRQVSRVGDRGFRHQQTRTKPASRGCAGTVRYV